MGLVWGRFPAQPPLPLAAADRHHSTAAGCAHCGEGVAGSVDDGTVEVMPHTTFEHLHTGPFVPGRRGFRAASAKLVQRTATFAVVAIFAAAVAGSAVAIRSAVDSHVPPEEVAAAAVAELLPGVVATVADHEGIDAADVGDSEVLAVMHPDVDIDGNGRPDTFFEVAMLAAGLEPLGDLRVSYEAHGVLTTVEVSFTDGEGAVVNATRR